MKRTMQKGKKRIIYAATAAILLAAVICALPVAVSRFRNIKDESKGDSGAAGMNEVVENIEDAASKTADGEAAINDTPLNDIPQNNISMDDILTGDISSDADDISNMDDGSGMDDVSDMDDVSNMDDGLDTEEREADADEEAAKGIVAHMSVEDKVAQLFFVTPEALTKVKTVVQFGDTSKGAIKKYPVGGLVYFRSNLLSPEQTIDMLKDTQSFYQENQQDGLPIFLGVDEEGGRVTRIGGNPGFPYDKVASMQEIAKDGNAEDVKAAAAYIGAYLKELGFNLDLAPVADVLTNQENQVIGDRSFGAEPGKVSQMAQAYAEGLHQNGILAVYKHYPGHGSTKEDSHGGYAYIDKDLEQLLKEDLVPFADAGKNEVEFIMVGHISMPELTGGENIPASLSEYFVTELLRNELGYEGIVITDALEMGAISQHYTPAQSAVMAIKAGCDMLLMSSDFDEAYEAVLRAVRDGEIEEQRLDESVLRIVRVKMKMQITD